MPSRWDHLFEAKPIPIIEHFVEEVAKLMTKELEKWPLPVEELDVARGGKYVDLLGPDSRRPEPKVFEEAFRLTRWELLREFDAYDDYMRNERFAQRGVAPADKTAMLFVSQWLLEQLLAIAEATEGRVKRKHLVECVDKIERKLRGAPLILA